MADTPNRQYSRRAFLRLAAGTTATLLLPGCRRTATPGTPEPVRHGWVETGAYRKRPPWRLGRSSRGDIGPWMVMFSAHVEYGVREAYQAFFGGYLPIAANWDPNKQIEDIRALLTQEIDLLLIDPLDTTVVAQGLTEAMAAGVPVILASTRVSGAPYVSWVATDAEERGANCAAWLCSSIAGGRVAVLHSWWAAGDTELWLRGVRRQLEEHVAIEATFAQCAWSVDGARQAMTDILRESGGVEGVLVQSGVLGRGAVEALAERGEDMPLLAGVDDWNGWLRTAQAHSVRFLAQSGGTSLGLRCVQLATQVLAGERVPAWIDFPYETFDQTTLNRYLRPDLSDHYWAIHDLPEIWIERMFNV